MHKTKSIKIAIYMLPVCALIMCYVFKNTLVLRQSDIMMSILSATEKVFYFIMLVKIFTSSYKLKTLILMALFITVLVASYLMTGQFELLGGSITLIYLNGRREKTVFENIFVAFSISAFLVCFLYLLGVGRNENGFYLGFATKNIAGRIVYYVLVIFLISKGSKWPVRKMLLASELFALFLWIVIGARASAILAAVLPFLYLIFRKMQRAKSANHIATLLGLFPLELLALIIFTADNYSANAFIQFINHHFLSNRIYMNYVALYSYGYTPFGQAANISSLEGHFFDSVVGKYVNFLTIDCQYIYLIIYYGVIGTALWLLTNYIVTKKAWKNHNAMLYCVLLELQIYALTETIGSVFSMIPLLYLLVKPNNMKQDIEIYHPAVNQNREENRR